MSDESWNDHHQIAGLLPDFAAGELDERDLARVADHLDGCAACQNELAGILELVGLLSATPPPSAGAKDAFLRRVAARTAELDEEPDPVVPPAAPTPLPRRAGRWGGFAAHPGWVAGLAAGLLLAAGIGLGVLLEPRLANDDDGAAIAALIEDSLAPRPLTDSQLAIPASGVVYAAPERRQALLIALGLPGLEPDRRYQVWLFTGTGERLSGGLFDVDAGGVGQILIAAPDPFAAYRAVGISAEPAAGSAAPTSPLVLGGWIG